jgi:serine protease
MLQIRMRLPLLRHHLICLLLGLAAAPALAADPVAFGLIVGYRADADELSAEHTERGPWADRRHREQAAWKRATQRSREKTQALAKTLGLPVRSVGEAGRAALMRLDKPLRGKALADVMRRLRLHPDVAWVEPNVMERQQTVVPNDPGWGNQWHLRAPRPDPITDPILDPMDFQPAAMNLPAAWLITTGESTPEYVAVVDTGIRASHPDLAGKIVGGYDFIAEEDFAGDGNGRDPDPSDEGDWVTRTGNPPAVQQYVDDGACGDFNDPSHPNLDRSSWHGTFIAGQIAAQTNNGAGVAGLHWGAQIVPVRVAGKCGALLSDLFDGVRWAAGLPVSGVPQNPHRAKVINLSFGGSSACTAGYQSMVDDVLAAGSLLVVAAGNNATTLRRPADCAGVMTVAAVRRDGAKAGYSSFGTNVALAAPGGSLRNAWDASLNYRAFDNEDVMLLSTYNSGLQGPETDNYAYNLGTSFSAPQAAGVAALMLSLNPKLTPYALMERMKLGVREHTDYMGATCSPVNNGTCDCTETTCGAGLLDAQRALQLARGPAAVIEAVGTVLPGAQITLDGSGSLAITGRSIVSHQWTQVSGPRAISIPDSTQEITTFALPASVEGRWVFRLTVRDDMNEEGSDVVAVVAATPPPSGGGGALGWAWGAGLWAWVLALGWRQRRR